MKCLLPHINRIDKYKFFSVGIVSFSVSERKGDSISTSVHTCLHRSAQYPVILLQAMIFDLCLCYVLRHAPMRTGCHDMSVSANSVEDQSAGSAQHPGWNYGRCEELSAPTRNCMSDPDGG